MSCPCCKKADAIMRETYTATAATDDISVQIRLPQKVCGRCGENLANVAAMHAYWRWLEMREHGK